VGVSGRAVVDTSVLIGSIAVLPGELAISTVSLAELQFGVLVAKTPEQRAARLTRLSRIQRHFDPLPVDEAVADSYAVLAAKVASQGRKPRARSMDLLIAATAHAHGAALYTLNSADLAGIESVVEIREP